MLSLVREESHHHRILEHAPQQKAVSQSHSSNISHKTPTTTHSHKHSAARKHPTSFAAPVFPNNPAPSPQPNCWGLPAAILHVLLSSTTAVGPRAALQTTYYRRSPALRTSPPWHYANCRHAKYDSDFGCGCGCCLL
jgi:hypothetical protein